MTTFLKNIIFSFAFCSLLCSCDVDSTKPKVKKEPKQATKQLIAIDSSKIVLIHEKHDNGNVKFYGTSYDSLYHGYCKTFFLNEMIATQGNYYLGSKEGWWEYYYENGQLKECGHYALDLLTGTWRYYDYYGNMTHEKNFLDGKLHGWCKSFVDNVLIEECEYQLGKKQGYCHFYENGILILKGNYFNDIKVGVWKTFNSNGKIVHEEDFG
jgi:antitoxin component YwqK of YwqJK toxin-antitoxin module